MEQDVGQLGLERRGVLVGCEVAALTTPARDRARDTADHLLDRVLARRRSDLTAEVLLSHDVGRVLRPRLGELDIALLERNLVAVADARVAQLPLDGVKRMDSGRREMTPDRQSAAGLRLLASGVLLGLLHLRLLLSLPLLGSL